MYRLGVNMNIVVASKFLKFGRTTFRKINTSGKKKESTGTFSSPESAYKNVPDFSKPSENKNWVSYGFSTTNKEDDTFLFHIFMFSFFSIMVGGMGFVALYFPNFNRKDWAQREAFIRLHEREQLGLDPIDPNYVDPSKIILPPDAELEEDDIII